VGGYRVQGLGFRVRCLGFRVEGVHDVDVGLPVAALEFGLPRPGPRPRRQCVLPQVAVHDGGRPDVVVANRAAGPDGRTGALCPNHLMADGGTSVVQGLGFRF